MWRPAPFSLARTAPGLISLSLTGEKVSLRFDLSKVSPFWGLTYLSGWSNFLWPTLPEDFYALEQHVGMYNSKTTTLRVIPLSRMWPQLFSRKFGAYLLFCQLCFYSVIKVDIDNIKFTSKFIKG